MISNFTSVVVSVIGKDRIKKTESAKGGFGYENQIKNIEKRLNNDGIVYLAPAMQLLRDLFGTYIESWEYSKIEKEVEYNK